jgi:hypothetical protein
MPRKIRAFFSALVREDGRLFAVASIAGISALATYILARGLGLVR